MMAGQFRPEQQPQPQQPQRTAQQHVTGDPLTEEHPGIEGIPQRGRGKHHRHQAAGNPLTGGEETHEIDAEKAQPLGQTNQMTATVHHLQSPAEQEHRKQDQGCEAEAIDNRYRDGDDAQLQFQRNPGGAPDEHGEQV